MEGRVKFSNMVEVRVNKPWHGMIAIRDKYYMEALKESRGLVIKCEGNSMLIPSNNVKGMVKSISKQYFKDRYSNERHRLIYFDWKPSSIQKKLF